jgi:hypothetical protein
MTSNMGKEEFPSTYKMVHLGCGHGSPIEPLPHMAEALDSIPSATKKKKKNPQKNLTAFCFLYHKYQFVCF